MTSVFGISRWIAKIGFNPVQCIGMMRTQAPGPFRTARASAWSRPFEARTVPE
jgi:hypothetical protein